MPRCAAACCVVLCCGVVVTAEAAEAADAEKPVSSAPPAQTRWEGAIRFSASYSPEYSGSAKNIAKISPALFLRYGRFTTTNASGFVTRRADDVVRGLGMDLSNSDRFRANLALRVDRGRGENSS